ncbi:MAG: type IV-A pilus assembly ATPase PilB [Bdellovibrionales bacterium]
MAKKLGELLVLNEKINIDQLNDAKKEQKNHGGRLGTALLKLGYIDEKELTEFLSEQYNVPSIDLDIFEIDRAALAKIPKNICEKYVCIPISLSGNTLVVAMSDPSNIFAVDDLTFISKCKIQTVVCTETAILGAVEKYMSEAISYDKVISEMEDETVANFSLDEKREDDSTVDLAAVEGDEAPVVQFINMLLAESIKLKASDIHIEPYEKRFRIRFRVDGTLSERIQPPQGMASSIISRLKIMSRLDISERRKPQDGRLKIRMKGGQEVDFRVSCCPVIFGEKIVLRLLDKSNLQLDMTKLGFERDQLDMFLENIHKPYGMVLITGPTGSGKSTTIYSALAELNKIDTNIATAEDPVEFNLEGINQVQMNHDVGLNFASALRSFLRQDPDVILVGEIRDKETAEVGFKAALTGHMVVSTLHTNDAPGTINRLLNMGVEPFMITSAINCVVAQRLAKTLCSSCKKPIKLTDEQLRSVGVAEELIPTAQVMKGEGCKNCNGTGNRGRVAVQEVMTFDDVLKQGVFDKLSPVQFRQLCVDQGMKSMRMSAVQKMLRGEISMEQVFAVSVGG